jgi:uncharacterized protein (DUF697 family)
MSDYKKAMKSAKLESGELMTSAQLTACNGIIHTAAVASGAAGTIPIPVADAIPITAAQITMIISLGRVFEVQVTNSVAKAILTAVAAPLVGRTAVSAGLKFIPIAGWVVSAAVAAGVTEAVGWLIANDFARDYKAKYMEKRKLDTERDLENEREKNEIYESDDGTEADDPGKYL